jgi:hypothetical protein
LPDQSQEDGPSIHSNPISFFAWSSAVVMFLLEIPALSIVVFLRHSFGCRFLKLWMILVSLALLWSVYSFSSPFTVNATPARLFGLIMLGLAVHHYRDAWARFWASGGHPEKLWHSGSDGIPWLSQVFPIFSDRVIKTLIEPAVAALAALGCLVLAFGSPGEFRMGLPPFALWLGTAAVSHMLLEAMLYEQRLHKFIDMVDENIEAASMQEVMTAFTEKREVEPSPEGRMGNPVMFTPDLFNVMQAARQRNEKARARAKSAGENVAAAAAGAA